MMSTSADDGLRSELREAIASVRRQIEIQSMSDHYIGSGRITEDALIELRSELVRLEEALAGLR